MSEEIRLKALEGIVASIINERELAINIGSSLGVKTGMKFKVLAEIPTEIHDPDTNELLGFFDRDKVRVEATEVQERFSICRTYRKKTIRASSYYDMIDIFGQRTLSSPPREVVETLKVEDASLPAPLSEDESYVKKGDRVVQLIDDE